MNLASPAHMAAWSIAALSVLGVIVRPWKIPEALWAVLGAAALALFSLISMSDVLAAILVTVALQAQAPPGRKASSNTAPIAQGAT
jgi:Na+/H+ antiporter NhaD/arsenite permease-like protein